LMFFDIEEEGKKKLNAYFKFFFLHYFKLMCF
jgi:hypothetical protein